jgi:hypothetical protein
MAWRVKDDQMFRFINGPKVHFPLRCEGKAIQGDKVCGKCADKRNKPKPNKNTGNHPQIWWGTIDEVVKDFGVLRSRMWGSPWFYEKAKAGYTISPEDMPRVKKIVQGTAMEELPDALSATPLPAAAAVEKKKRATKAKEEPKKIKIKVKVKNTEITQPIAVVQEEAIEAEEVHVVQVIKKELNGKQYYYDSGKKKLYEPSTGKYVGRWDSVKELVITSIPDSDSE